jgi:hypothetical protein
MTSTADIESVRRWRCRIDLRDNPFTERGAASAETNAPGTLRNSPDTKQTDTAHETENLTSILDERNPISLPVTSPTGRPTLSHILDVVSAFYELPRSDLISCRRTRRIARPRQIAMALARELTANSTSRIGQRFGKRDHSTVLHAIEKITALAKDDLQIATDLAELRARLSPPIDGDDLETQAPSPPEREPTSRETHAS